RRRWPRRRQGGSRRRSRRARRGPRPQRRRPRARSRRRAAGRSWRSWERASVVTPLAVRSAPVAGNLATIGFAVHDMESLARLALTLFADELETGGDPTPSVLATGMAGRHPVAEALVQGEVRASAWRANEVTGRRFAWARVAALGGEVDVLTARDLPAPGTA